MTTKKPILEVTETFKKGKKSLCLAFEAPPSDATIEEQQKWVDDAFQAIKEVEKKYFDFSTK